MPEVQLFVGNVPGDVSSSQLRELLSRVATVTAVFVPTDRLTGKPRGFAIVEVPSEADAREIAREFNGYILDGRRLRIEAAPERRMEAAYRPKYGGRFAPKRRPEPRRHRPERSPGR
jgi:RNA recognition motif-containing protein